MTNKEFAASLRLLADFYEEKPNFPQFESDEVSIYMCHHSLTLLEYAQELKTFKKESAYGYFMLKRDFGSLTLVVNAAQTDVCKKIVTGTRKVMKKVPIQEVEYKEVEVDEDIVEWECPSAILEGKKVE